MNSTATTTANILARTLTISSVAASKMYDSTPTTTAVLSDDKVGGDTVNDLYTTALFNNEHVANNKTVTVSGLGISGADAPNYVLAYTSTTTLADITARPLSIAADLQTKIYGAVDPALTYAITSGVLQGSDAFSGSLARAAGENVGTYLISQSTLTAGTDYTLTYATSTLDITARPLTITAATSTKTYDTATTTATLPTITSGTLVGSDAASFFETFADKVVGTSKLLTPHGLVTDGNSGLNYSYTFVPQNLGTINALNIIGSITASSKTYDGNASSTIATHTLAGVLGLDDVHYMGGMATFNDKTATTSKLVTATGLNITGTDAGNYSVNSTATTTADIIPEALTLTADSQTKVYGTTDPSLTYQVTSGTLYAGDLLAGSLARVAGENVGAYAITQSVPFTNSNYSISYVGDNLTITPKPLIVTATGNHRIYNGTNSAAALPSLSATLIGSDTPGFWEVYDSKEFGLNKTMIPLGLVNDGNGGLNYSYSFVNTSTGIIDPIANGGPAMASVSTGRAGAGAIAPIYMPPFAMGKATPAAPTSSVNPAPAPAPQNIPAPVITRTLALNLFSPQVSSLQSFLSKAGFFKGPMTGFFGSLTKAAVMKFQKAHGIAETGTVGPITRAAMGVK